MTELEYILKNGSHDHRFKYLKLAFDYINRSRTCRVDQTNIYAGFRERYFDNKKDWSKRWWGPLGAKYFGNRNPNLYYEQVGILIAEVFRFWINFTACSVASVQKRKQGCRTRTEFLLESSRETLGFAIENHQAVVSDSFLEEMRNFFEKCDLYYDHTSPIMLTEKRKYPEWNDTFRRGTAFFFISQPPNRFI